MTPFSRINISFPVHCKQVEIRLFDKEPFSNKNFLDGTIEMSITDTVLGFLKRRQI